MSSPVGAASCHASASDSTKQRTSRMASTRGSTMCSGQTALPFAPDLLRFTKMRRLTEPSCLDQRHLWHRALRASAQPRPVEEASSTSGASQRRPSRPCSLLHRAPICLRKDSETASTNFGGKIDAIVACCGTKCVAAMLPSTALQSLDQHKKTTSSTCNESSRRSASTCTEGQSPGGPCHPLQEFACCLRSNCSPFRTVVDVLLHQCVVLNHLLQKG